VGPKSHLKGQGAFDGESLTHWTTADPEVASMWNSSSRDRPGRLLADSDIPVDIFSVDVEAMELKKSVQKTVRNLKKLCLTVQKLCLVYFCKI
jgi:hypothetical protein